LRKVRSPPGLRTFLRREEKAMTDSLPIILALSTLILVAGVAVWSKYRTEQRRTNDTARKSSLAVDGDPHRAAK
jgi:cbb3-type cytochrome oxidase subunit 3